MFRKPGPDEKVKLHFGDTAERAYLQMKIENPEYVRRNAPSPEPVDSRVDQPAK